MRAPRTFAILLVIGAVVAGLGFWAQKGPAVVETSNPAPALVAEPPTGTVKAAETVSAIPNRIDLSANMRKKFESTTNYAAFVHDALSRPEEGGRFFAFIAYNMCEGTNSVAVNESVKVEGDPLRRVAAAEVVDSLQKKCDGVKEMFSNYAIFMRTLRSANSKGIPDVYWRERKLGAPRTGANNEEDLKLALGHQDPYLIAATLERDAPYFLQATDPAFAQGRNQHVAQMAAAAVTCEILSNCVYTYLVMTPCVSGGWCKHTDFRLYLRDGLAKEDQILFDKATRALLKKAGR